MKTPPDQKKANVGISCPNLIRPLPALAIGPSVKDYTPVRRVPK